MVFAVRRKNNKKNTGEEEDGMQLRLGKYEIGATLGEGNFGKIKREITALKLLKHPNVVRLHEVLASKTKIYMVLDNVNGGELFDTIVSKGKLPQVNCEKVIPTTD